MENIHAPKDLEVIPGLHAKVYNYVGFYIHVAKYIGIFQYITDLNSVPFLNFFYSMIINIKNRCLLEI